MRPWLKGSAGGRWWAAPGAAFVLLVLVAASPAAPQEMCADCHETDVEPLANSVHGFLECADCHVGAEEVPHPEAVSEASCGACHDGVVDQLAASVHGRAALPAGLTPPGCVSCHGDAHEIVPGDDPASPTHPQRLAATCGGCHGNPEMARRAGLLRIQPLEAYLASVHARALAKGEEAADCSTCHGSHLILAASNPASTVSRQRVPETCGECHAEITRAYEDSIHGKAAAAGVRESPVCTDCHGEHRILSHVEKASPVFASNIPRMTCGRCHGDLRLAQKYGLDPDKVPAYADSYHGLASRAGAVTVAHCGSCHGIHHILPSSDPRSPIHADNLARTCGQCHPGAGRTFAIGEVHVLPTERQHAAVYWVRVAYLWLIYLTIGAMVLHNLADFYRKVERPPARPLRADPASPERMSLGFRVAHGLLAASFIVLVYTGFALKYPEAWWAEPVLRWEGSFGLRGWLHRTAAVVLLGAGLFHLVHLIVSRQARACLAGMRPGREDWTEIKERLSYFAGRRTDPPHSSWIGYAEKVEYLAVVWGAVIMSLTGFVLWFEDFFLRWVPKWVTDVATVVHFYEAVLATLAILVWHLYLVIFDPVVYPFDPAWITGRSAPGRSAERRGPEPEIVAARVAAPPEPPG